MSPTSPSPEHRDNRRSGLAAFVEDLEKHMGGPMASSQTNRFYFEELSGRGQPVTMTLHREAGGVVYVADEVWPDEPGTIWRRRLLIEPSLSGPLWQGWCGGWQEVAGSPASPFALHGFREVQDDDLHRILWRLALAGELPTPEEVGGFCELIKTCTGDERGNIQWHEYGVHAVCGLHINLNYDRYLNESSAENSEVYEVTIKNRRPIPRPEQESLYETCEDYLVMMGSGKRVDTMLPQIKTSVYHEVGWGASRFPIKFREIEGQSPPQMRPCFRAQLQDMRTIIAAHCPRP